MSHSWLGRAVIHSCQCIVLEMSGVLTPPAWEIRAQGSGTETAEKDSRLNDYGARSDWSQ